MVLFSELLGALETLEYFQYAQKLHADIPTLRFFLHPRRRGSAYDGVDKERDCVKRFGRRATFQPWRRDQGAHQNLRLLRRGDARAMGNGIKQKTFELAPYLGVEQRRHQNRGAAGRWQKTNAASRPFVERVGLVQQTRDDGLQRR